MIDPKSQTGATLGGVIDSLTFNRPFMHFRKRLRKDKQDKLIFNKLGSTGYYYIWLEEYPSSHSHPQRRSYLCAVVINITFLAAAQMIPTTISDKIRL